MAAVTLHRSTGCDGDAECASGSKRRPVAAYGAELPIRGFNPQQADTACSDFAGDPYDERLTVGQQLADKVASFGGSWTFIVYFLSTLAAWVVLNSGILARWHEAFDPYPYILLNLFLSMLAALQAPVIMMSQNRLAAKDRIQAKHDYEVNLRAEVEIAALHDKLDALRIGEVHDALRELEQQIEGLALAGRRLRTPPKSRRR